MEIIIILLVVLVLYLLKILYTKNDTGKTLDIIIRDKQVEINSLTVQKEDLKKEIEKYKNIFQENKEKFETLLELKENENQLKKSVENLDRENKRLVFEVSKSKESKKELAIYKQEADLIEFGFFEEPNYLFETSERYRAEIKVIRDKQKEMIKNKTAVDIPKDIAVIEDDKIAKQILEKQAKLMLKAFNIECDNLIGMVKSSNFSLILEKIEKLAKDIEELSISYSCGFSNDYVRLKFEECELQYQFKLRYQKEQEEQQAIREQIKEEQQAIRDYQKAILKAQRDEEIYQEALERARKELEISTEEEKEKLLRKIENLQLKLKEAEESSQRAKSMAEQTKCGHVYIISNIGSFGENVYKIGLTRRLDPMERVNELSNASVPFPFEVHAVIYSENAPELEKQLHNAFKNQRVNLVNQRKEFFNVDLMEIKEVAESITNNNIDFKLTAVAEDYYESLKLRKMLKN